MIWGKGMIPENHKLEPINFVSARHEPHRPYLGKGVEIHIGSTKYMGVYRGLTEEGQLVLSPHLAFNLETSIRDAHGYMNPHPAFIFFSTPGLAVLPRNEKEINAYANNWLTNEEADPACLI